MNKYSAFAVGDLVRMVGTDTGIVTKILDHGQVEVFWPSTNKLSTHGKEWAEIHMEILSEGR